MDIQLRSWFKDLLARFKKLERRINYIASEGGGGTIPATTTSIPVALSEGEDFLPWLENSDVPVGSSLLIVIDEEGGQPGLTNITKTDTEGGYVVRDISGDRISGGELSMARAIESGGVGYIAIKGNLVTDTFDNSYRLLRDTVQEVNSSQLLRISQAGNNIIKIISPIVINLDTSSGGGASSGSIYRMINLTDSPIEVIPDSQANIISLENKHFIAPYGYAKIICIGINGPVYDYFLTGDLVEAPI